MGERFLKPLDRRLFSKIFVSEKAPESVSEKENAYEISWDATEGMSWEIFAQRMLDNARSKTVIFQVGNFQDLYKSATSKINAFVVLV